MEYLFGDCRQELKEFHNWAKSRERTSMSLEMYENVANEVETKPAEVQAAVSWLLQLIEKDSLPWQKVQSAGSAGHHLRVDSCTAPAHLYRITYHSHRPESELRALFVESMKWYRWATFSRVDPYTKTLSVTMQLGQQPRKFRFECEVLARPDGDLLVKKPYAKRGGGEGVGSFYEIVKVGRASRAPRTAALN